MTQPQLGEFAVVIGPKEIYDQLVQLNTRLAVLVGEHADTDRTLRELQGRVNGDVETRLRGLERARWPLPALALLVSAAGVAIALLALLGGTP